MKSKFTLSSISRAVALAALVALTAGDSLARPVHGGASSGGGGGGDVFLTDATVIEPSGSNQTNMVATFGMAYQAGNMDGSHYLKVVDNDTGLPINCDENNRFSDQTPQVRGESVTCVIPSITASAVKILKLYKSAGTTPTGSDIAVSDVTAAFSAASSYDMPVVFQKLNGGNDYTASLVTALSSGNSGWINKTTPTVMGYYRHGGGLITEWIVFAPAVHSGTPDAQMHVMFDISCIKASRAAYNASTNPLLGCKIDEINQNGWAQITSPVDDWYGLCVGTSCATASYPNSTPSVALTLSSNSVTSSNTATPITAASPMFSLNSQGMLISDGTGVAPINNYTDTTHAGVFIAKAFGSTSIGSGTYTLYGINHPYGSRFSVRGWFGFAHAQPTVEAQTVYLGDPWNSGTQSGGPAPYMISTYLVPNYSYSPSSVTNDVSSLNLMGTNPMGYNMNANGFTPLYLETTGGRGDIAVIPQYTAQALIRYDSNAAPIIFGQAARWQTFNVNYRDQNSGGEVQPCNAGTLPSCAGSTNYVWNTGISGTQIPQAANSIMFWQPDTFSHDPEGFIIAALLTGDYYWVDGEQAQYTYTWMGAPSTPVSYATMDRNIYSSVTACCTLSPRGVSWAQRDQLYATLVTPDNAPAGLGWTKAIAKEYLHQEIGGSTNSWAVNYLANTSAGNNTFNNNGQHFFGGIDTNHDFIPWMNGYMSVVLGAARESGMLDSDGLNLFNWTISNQVQMTNNSHVVPAYMGTGYNIPAVSPNNCGGTQNNTWPTLTENTIKYAAPYTNGPARITGTTATLSAVSGTNVIVNLPSGSWFGGGSVYVGGWFTASDNNGNTTTVAGPPVTVVGGSGQIVAVNSPTQIVVDTTASATYEDVFAGCFTYQGSAFSGTSLSAGTFALPWPYIGDPIGTEWARFSLANLPDAFEVYQGGLIYGCEFNVSGSAAALATGLGYTGGQFAPGNDWQIGVPLTCGAR